MTDISELVQKKELLIANGYETAELLRNLAENEIDSDCFAVTSECESHGKEVDAYLSITEFALQAACYVDELTEELEKALTRIAELEARAVKLPESFYPDGDIDCPLVLNEHEVIETIESIGVNVTKWEAK